MKGNPEQEGNNSTRTWTRHLEGCWNFIYILPPLIASLLSNSTPSTKHLKDDEGSSSKWSEIGDDVFGLILQRLCVTDYLRTEVVCINWRNTVVRSMAKKFCPPLPDKLPLLFLHHAENNDSNKHFPMFSLPTKEHFSMFNLSTKSVSPCYSGILSLGFSDCCGTVQGWLIMIDRWSSGTIFFFNPLTETRVLMKSRLQCDHRIGKIVASAKPSDPDCVVVCHFADANMIALCGISDDSWTLIKGSVQENIIFMEIEILDGKLYALNCQNFDSVIVFDLQNKPLKPKLLAVTNPPSTIRASLGDARVGSFRFLAIDDSSGELLLIDMFYNSTLYGCYYSWETNDNLFVPKFVGSRVYKLSMKGISSGSEEEAEWIRVKDLGNRMLFVGKRKSLVVASNVGGGVQGYGPRHLRKDNCIYFTFQVPNRDGKSQHRKGIRVGRYCESDKKTDHYICKPLMSDMLLSSIWFIPSLW